MTRLRLLALGLGLLSLAGAASIWLALGARPPAASATTSPTLAFSPTAQTVALSQAAAVDVTIATVTNLGGYDLWVFFNPAVVQMTGLTDAGFVTANPTNIVVCNTPVIDNTAGSGNLSCATVPVFGTPGPGVSTTTAVALAHATFNAAANGTSGLALSNVSTATTLQDPLGVDITPIVLGAGSITVGSSTPTPTATPTATATSTPVPTPTPCGPDTNGDGITDCWEVQYACLNVSSPDASGDPDGDGLTNLQEYLRGTNPCNPDTDGDGYTDGQEVTLGKDPLTYCAIMRADVNADGKVNLLDLGAVAAWFGQSIPPAPARYDQNADRKINLLDLGAMANRFGQTVMACP